MGLIEKILEINKENIGKIHFWGGFALILTISKILFKNKMDEIINNLVMGLGSFKFIINIIELIFIILFILSILVILIGIFYTAVYVLMYVISERCNIIRERTLELRDKLYSFFLGSKMAVLRINRYLIIFTCYFYVFAEKDFCEYIDIIYSFIDKENLDFVSIIYTIYIGVAFISLLRIIAYNFLYFNYNVVSNEREK